MNLHQAKPTPKEPNLNKLGDADGCKCNGCPTQLEPILESRAVYSMPSDQSAIQSSNNDASFIQAQDKTNNVVQQQFASRSNNMQPIPAAPMLQERMDTTSPKSVKELRPYVEQIAQIFSSLEGQGLSRETILNHLCDHLAGVPLAKDQKADLLGWLGRLKIVTEAEIQNIWKKLEEKNPTMLTEEQRRAATRLNELSAQAALLPKPISPKAENLFLYLVNIRACDYLTDEEKRWGCFAVFYHPDYHGTIYTEEERQNALDPLTGDNGITIQDREWIENQLCNCPPYRSLPKEAQDGITEAMLRQERIQGFSADLYREWFKNRIMARRRLEFASGKAGAEATQLE